MGTHQMYSFSFVVFPHKLRQACSIRLMCPSHRRFRFPGRPWYPPLSQRPRLGLHFNLCFNQVQADVAAIAMEEVLPSSVADADALAPEEVYAKKRGRDAEFLEGEMARRHTIFRVILQIILSSFPCALEVHYP